jgi:hypothetical protein
MRGIVLSVVAAMLVVAVAVPVIAQDYYQDYVEPPVEGASDYVPPPDLAAQCASDLQFGNTGNLNNAYDSTGDGEFGEFDPETETACEEAVQQSSAASS